jgi:hypothetical protein
MLLACLPVFAYSATLSPFDNSSSHRYRTLTTFKWLSRCTTFLSRLRLNKLTSETFLFPVMLAKALGKSGYPHSLGQWEKTRYGKFRTGHLLPCPGRHELVLSFCDCDDIYGVFSHSSLAWHIGDDYFAVPVFSVSSWDLIRGFMCQWEYYVESTDLGWAWGDAALLWFCGALYTEGLKLLKLNGAYRTEFRLYFCVKKGIGVWARKYGVLGFRDVDIEEVPETRKRNAILWCLRFSEMGDSEWEHHPCKYGEENRVVGQEEG